MLKKTIKYTDYENVEREEDFYFNLNKAELMEMEMGTVGGLQKKLEKIIKEQDSSKIIQIFKEIILKAYGEKSDDGKRFVKFRNGVRLADEFAESAAFPELFFELAGNENAAADFINGIIPQQMAAELANNPQITAMRNN